MLGLGPMDTIKQLETAMGQVVGFLWGPPLVVLLVGGGLFFLFYSRLLYLKHLFYSIP